MLGGDIVVCLVVGGLFSCLIIYTFRWNLNKFSPQFQENNRSTICDGKVKWICMKALRRSQRRQALEWKTGIKTVLFKLEVVKWRMRQKCMFQLVFYAGTKSPSKQFNGKSAHNTSGFLTFHGYVRVLPAASPLNKLHLHSSFKYFLNWKIERTIFRVFL